MCPVLVVELQFQISYGSAMQTVTVRGKMAFLCYLKDCNGLEVIYNSLWDILTFQESTQFGDGLLQDLETPMAD